MDDGESPDSETTPVEDWRECSFLPGGGVEVQAPDLIFAAGWGVVCYHPAWMEVRAANPSSLTLLQRVAWDASLQTGKWKLAHLAFVGLGVMGVIVFLRLVASVENFYLKVFCLAKFPFPGLLARESRVSFVLFVGVSRLLACLALDYMSTKKTQRTHHSVVTPWVPELLAYLFLFHSLLMFALYTVSWAFVLNGRNRERNLRSIFPKVKVSFLFSKGVSMGYRTLC